jgi:hypothetical protein
MTRSLPVKLTPSLASAVRTFAGATSGIFISNEIDNSLGYDCLIVRTMPTAKTGSGTLDIKVQGYDEMSAVWYDIAGASLVQISANRTTAIDLIIGRSLTAVANRVVSTVLPKRVRVHTTLGASGADGFTYGIETELHP